MNGRPLYAEPMRQARWIRFTPDAFEARERMRGLAWTTTRDVWGRAWRLERAFMKNNRMRLSPVIRGEIGTIYGVRFVVSR